MNVLIVGGGGREAALAWKIDQSPVLSQLFVSHDNPGFPKSALHCRASADAAAAAEIDLVVIGPEAPLAAGLANDCRDRGIAVFGPDRDAAVLESSKAWAKAFMVRHDIPTGNASAHMSAESAKAAISGPCVVKADGLAAGKGVFVCKWADEARAAVDRIFEGAIGGAGVLIEERLSGEEVSVLALCDGERFVICPPAQDHKRRFDGDAGPNTGGMGAYAPAPVATPALLDEVARTVIAPTLAGMAAEGSPFIGVLYAGIMVTDDGPKVLEFNVRFGDPECQPVMMMLDEDLLPRLLACARGELDPSPLRIRSGSACCVVMVSDGYPGAYAKGKRVEGLDAEHDDVVVFQAGTHANGADVVTDGGRVLGVTAWGEDLQTARDRAYRVVDGLHFEGARWRTDIAARGLTR